MSQIQMPATMGRVIEPEPLSTVVIRWATRASVVAFALSLIVHLIMAGVGYMVHVRLGGTSINGPVGPVEVAVMSSTEFAAIEEAELSATAPGVEENRRADMDTHVAIDLPGGSGMADTGDIGALGDGLGGAGAGTGIGVGDGAGGAGGGSAKFFNVETRGNRFAFIVDKSGSMAEGGKMEAVKLELCNTIDGLPEGTQFAVIFFSNTTDVLLGREQWLSATPKNKNEMIRAIQRIEPFGGTEPLPAFRIVFNSYRPRPDVVYFLTDGVFDPADGDRASAMSRAAGKIPIHTMAFVSEEGGMILRKMARDTGGSYTFVKNTGRK